ncbi:MAG: methylmalonyl-CoA mutase family protein [Bacteroidota bacterium]
MQQDKKLFHDFPPVTGKEWKDKVIADLKGADEGKLTWKTIEGIDVSPFYTEDDLPSGFFGDTMPGCFPYIRGNRESGNSWLIRQDFHFTNPGETNVKMREAIKRGVEALGICCCGCPDSGELTETGTDGFSSVFEGIDMEKIPVHFINQVNPMKCLAFIRELAQNRGIDSKKLTGSVAVDPLGFFSMNGRFHDEEAKVFDQAASLIQYGKEELPGYRLIEINAVHFHNCGASITQELGFALSVVVEYLHRLTDRNQKAEDITPRMQLVFATGSGYFMEIAKIRAARLLFAKIAELYGCSPENSRVFIHGVSSSWNKTIYDPYVNMLRTTTETMSSALGGVDSYTVLPFDNPFRSSGEFSERVARNQQIILKEEARFDKVADPAAGSYYIENLTKSIAEEAWKIFTGTEKDGGYLTSFRKGNIQKAIRETADAKNSGISSRREVFLGTNQYPERNERISENVDLAVAFPVRKADGREAEPLVQWRGAQEFELMRLKTERMPVRPKVFLLTFGNLAMRKARATFAANFFSCAGFEIIDNPGFESAEDGAVAALSSGADITVICSSDEEYPSIVPDIIKTLGSGTIPVLAGYPKEQIDAFKSLGLRHFIHVRSNILDTLLDFQKMLENK